MKRYIKYAFLCIVLFTALFLVYEGIIPMNHPSSSEYPVRGVDVSHYQGTIHWNTLEEEGIRFAYIKATEGSSSIDEQFPVNWSEASGTGLRIGAYHFFSFESGGKGQAENFLRCVQPVGNMLPPAVDLEPYGRYSGIKDADPAILDELEIWLLTVEERFGLKPIIYTTRTLYKSVHNRFPEYSFWIRSVYVSPPEDIQWTFWQYSNRTKLSGYSGPERFIDLNVFSGTVSEFEQFGKNEYLDNEVKEQ